MKVFNFMSKILSDKIPCTVGLVKCILRVPELEVHFSCCLLRCCQGKLGDLSEESAQSLCRRYFAT